MSAKLETVHVRINDAATGQPTPVRIRFTDAEGNYHAPFGRLTDFATGVNEDVGGNLLLGGAKYCVIDGACEIALPRGTISVEISKGFEYQPIRQEVSLTPGKLALRFQMERWLDLRAEGWYAGDGRAHFLSPHAALIEGAAEDLAVVNLLALSWQPARQSPALSNLLAFSGQEPALEMPGHLVAVNTFNTCPLGQLALLNCHRVVYPLIFDRINWTMADWCDQCHRKGGLVAWPEHEFWPHPRDDDFVSEGLADLIMGKVDVFEVDMLPWRMEDEPDWYTLLNSGLRVPLLGASRKKANTSVLGCVRSYARLQTGEEFNYKNWIEAVRAGRTFVTNGPLLFFTVNGQGPGAILDLPAATPAQIRAEARSLVPFDRLEVVHNGMVVAEQAATGSPAAALFEGDLAVASSGWWAARCLGQQPLHSSFCPQPVGAHTSPIYVNLDGRPMTNHKNAVQDLLDYMDRFDRMVNRLALQDRFENDRDRERLIGIVQSTRAVLSRKMAEVGERP